MSLNPFHNLIESKHYKTARAKRTGLGSKLADSFFVFAGSFFFGKEHMGLFDYATLMLPYAITRAALASANKVSSNRAYLAICIPLALLAVPLGLVRYGLSAALTLITSPFALLAHGIAKLTGSKYQHRVNRISIPEAFNPKQKLNSYFNPNDGMRVVANCKGSSYKDLAVYFSKKVDSDSVSSSMVCEGCMMGNHEEGSHYDYKVNFNLESKTDRQQFKALLKLNIGGITRKLEKPTSGFDFSIFKVLKHSENGKPTSLVADEKPISTLKKRSKSQSGI